MAAIYNKEFYWPDLIARSDEKEISIVVGMYH